MICLNFNALNLGIPQLVIIDVKQIDVVKIIAVKLLSLSMSIVKHAKKIMVINDADGILDLCLE